MYSFKFFSDRAQIGFEDKAATACLPLIRTFSSIQPDVPEMFTNPYAALSWQSHRATC
jgi:hypothetical protein